MSCPDPALLAAAASDEAVHAHATACDRCSSLLVEQRATSLALAALAPPPLSAQRRLALEDALVVATQNPVPRPRWPIALAAAAVLLLALGALLSPPLDSLDSPTPSRTPSATASAPASASSSAPASVTAAPRITPLGTADHTLSASPDNHDLSLRDGVVLVDTTDTPATPVAIDLPDRTRVVIGTARATVDARKGALVAVHVFSGSVEVYSPTGIRTDVLAGEDWAKPRATTRTPAPALARDRDLASPASPTDAFRTGWLALRDGELSAAIAAFDVARADPAVAEEATFWSAIALERAGDTAAARARFARFLDEFPDSTRAAAARDHLAVIDTPVE
jgi:hypothetical protein